MVSFEVGEKRKEKRQECYWRQEENGAHDEMVRGCERGMAGFVRPEFSDKDAWVRIWSCRHLRPRFIILAHDNFGVVTRTTTAHTKIVQIEGRLIVRKQFGVQMRFTRGGVKGMRAGLFLLARLRFPGIIPRNSKHSNNEANAPYLVSSENILQ